MNNVLENIIITFPKIQVLAKAAKKRHITLSLLPF